MSTAQTQRLFYALWPAADIRRQLGEIAVRMAVGEAIPTQNYHLTIAFVGEVSAGRVTELREIGAALRAPRCELRLDALEYWPKPEVVVAAARQIPMSLARMWDDLHAALAAREFVLRVKRLRPHVTLARNVLQAPVLQPIASVNWEAAQFCLLRSHSGSARSLYTVVDTWPLLDTTEK